ncbi:MAG: M1 family aminopeptidase [Bacteroidota bacterium]|nr:M1 family aminopeptidase [Bacteroidota bacterium]
MKKSYLLLFLLFPFLGSFGQQRINMQSFYQQEWESIIDFMHQSMKRSVDTTYDVLFYHIDLDIAVDSSYIAGNVLMKARSLKENLDSIRLDLNRSLGIDSITMNAAGWDFSQDRITIQLDRSYDTDETFEVRVFYQGVPALAGGYKGLRYETHGDDEVVVATLSTPFVAHYWYPCKDGPQDKPDSVYVDISVPDTLIHGITLKGISNGMLEQESVVDDKRVFSWRHRYPIVTYYVMAAVSNYRLIADEYANDSLSFPLEYYVFDHNYSGASAAVENLPEVFDFFNDVFGMYPFYTEKYGMTELGFYGAIENQTNTIINSIAAPWFMVFVHELGHMWFGDMITCADWHHGWLNEGFATYSEALYTEHVSGFEEYQDHMEDIQYFLGGSLYLYELDTFQVFHPIIYNKGAWALHMLRGVLGEEVFFDAIQNYSTNPNLMYGNASTEDFRQVCENTSGEELAWFFDQWIYDEGFPLYRFNWAQEGETVAMSILQNQDVVYGYRDVFSMPLQFKFIFMDGSDTIVEVFNDQQLQGFYFAFDKTVSSAFVDPEKWVLRKTILDPGLPVNIEAHESKKDVVVFPNPAANSFTVQFNDDQIKYSELEILDSRGIILRRVFLDNSHTSVNISIADLQAGIYFIRIFGSSQTLKYNKLLVE